MVVGSGLLQPVVLVAHAGGWDSNRPSDRGVRPGGSVRLEDELPRSDPAGARTVLPVASRSDRAVGDSKCDVLVGGPRGIHARAIRDAVRRRGAFGGCACSLDAAPLAARVERFS